MRQAALTVRPIRVAMVTGAYFPELSGGGLQARAVVRSLSGQAEFIVITTSIDGSLPAAAEEDGVRIYRIHVDPSSRLSTLSASFRIARRFIALRRQIDIVNLHGFSRKAILLRLLALIFRKPFVLTLQTGGHDTPAAADALGSLAGWAYRNADLYLSVSPGLSNAYHEANLAPERLRQVCNAVDIRRFRPVDAPTRERLRERLSLPRDRRIIVFVGYFSRDKRPDVLFEAWRRLPAALLASSMIVYIGATTSPYREIDQDLADRIRSGARALGLAEQLHFVEWTDCIEDYFGAGDVYVLPSVREGLPIALIEAMSCGLPCIASRLIGSTDSLIESDRTGILVPPDDVNAFTSALAAVLTERETATRIGAAARAVVETRFSIEATAPMWLDAYRSVAAVGRA